MRNFCTPRKLSRSVQLDRRENGAGQFVGADAALDGGLRQPSPLRFLVFGGTDRDEQTIATRSEAVHAK